MTRLALRAALVAALVLPAGCPDTPSSDDAAAEPEGTPVDTAVDAALPDLGPELPDVQCEDDGDCAVPGALPACRAPRCVEGACVLGDADDGAPCDDGDACTGGDACAAGSCAGGEGPACDDGNACTTDACDPADGCVHTFNQKPCDDGSACTVEDRCLLGTCQGEALGCDDGNPCTDDACDDATGCSWTDNDAPCSDGDACTVGDRCDAGACLAGPPADCGEGNPCVTASCDPLLGCTSAPQDGACDDGDACTADDTCVEGACTGTLVVCDDGNACTSDYCDPAAGCVAVATTLPCSDGDPCTLADACSEGVCVPGPPDPLCCDVSEDCDDGEPCTEDVCDGGYCAFAPLDCDDGQPCTSDACVAGTCVSTPYGPLPSGPVLTLGFEEEGALSGWTVVTSNPEVTWQVDDAKAHTGTHSLYCGNVPGYTYDKGVTEATVTRDVSVPPGKASLTFWALQDVEESSCTYDATQVRVDGVTLQPQLCVSIPAWTQQVYDLTPWAGQTVALTFRFATTDSIANDGEGVRLDDVEIVADSPAGCCLLDADCAGTGCAAEACDPVAFACVAPDPAVACDDQDACTADACGEDGQCVNAPVEGCCDAPEDCPGSAELPCAVPTCAAGTCGLDTSACP